MSEKLNLKTTEKVNCDFVSTIKVNVKNEIYALRAPQKEKCVRR